MVNGVKIMVFGSHPHWQPGCVDDITDLSGEGRFSSRLFCSLNTEHLLDSRLQDRYDGHQAPSLLWRSPELSGGDAGVENYSAG